MVSKSLQNNRSGSQVRKLKLQKTTHMSLPSINFVDFFIDNRLQKNWKIGLLKKIFWTTISFQEAISKANPQQFKFEDEWLISIEKCE